MNKEYLTASTAELLTMLANVQIDAIECSIRSGCIRATHYVSLNDDTVFDIGIDDEECEWHRDAFLNHYAQTIWTIDQIIDS